MINVAVSGAAGRMGQAVCDAVEGEDDMALVGRADPLLDTALVDVLPDADVVVAEHFRQRVLQARVGAPHQGHVPGAFHRPADRLPHAPRGARDRYVDHALPAG